MSDQNAENFTSAYDATNEPAAKDSSKSTFSSRRSPVEDLALLTYLDLIGRRLSEIESRLGAKAPTNEAKSRSWIEFAKVLLGGWPAFGLLFMLLFYSPIRDAINAIPEKVRGADEIGLPGFSLKNTIRVEAERVGAIQLSETLPSLSPAAIEFLLRGTREQNVLISYSLDNADPNLISAIWLPHQHTLSILTELESKKLIAIRLGPSSEDRTVSDLKKAIDDLRREYPSSEEPGSNDRERVRYVLRTPAKVRPPSMSWRQTDLGNNAVGIILKAVATQLSPNPSKPGMKKEAKGGP